MSVQIVDNCITCGACFWECPTEAVSPGNPRPVINEQECTECWGFFGESQCMVVCPVNAIALHAEPIEQLAGRYAALEPVRAAQDTWIWRRLDRREA